ncbi:antibiotic biosynthesis monooxygenase [Endozoicomonas sp. SM1973]|uniref:Antibiotic biosynthesis monooxygenase n=1 Tax=Spartinivicinus marinus TaxID=2994442 RepID=A0A853IH57_9GAMM|nr:antibiotic biosynthesis monooxygenase [Spartinivicinus marinus]MCX4026834.1 antibiotic biosynthesis monooxygenase [Spartinivicinus marinus]NYZ69361.1 antibiotic biosynthesis monooxygenase [Spartinivicinus marinus]
MIAVIFEVELKCEEKAEYFSIANELKASLTNIEGFISVERFNSLSEPSRFLSLSFWESEESIKAWKNQSEHLLAQEKGKNYLFNNYRLRVAKVVRDYGSTCPQKL